MLAIVKGKVVTVSGETLEEGYVLIKDGKIQEVGSGQVPEGVEIIDVQGKWVLPGFIDAHCHVGIYEEIYRDEGDDTNETTDPVTPQLRAIDAINPEDLGFHDALTGGVTTVCTGPGSANVIGGEFVIMKTHGSIVDEMVLKAPAGLKIAFGENPKRVYSHQKKMPSTRMATAALLRETLVKAQNYMNKEDNKERDLKMEALVRVLKGEIPLRAHAHRADDIVTALRIAEEFGVKIVIEHCTEGHKIADFLAKKGVPAIIGPIITNRAKVELKDRTPSTVGKLSAAGVPIAIMTDHPVVPLNYLGLSAGIAVKEGLPEEEALKAITLYPAQILGLADRLGSLEVGKDADIVIMDGSPLEIKSKVEKVIIEGKLVYSI